MHQANSPSKFRKQTFQHPRVDGHRAFGLDHAYLARDAVQMQGCPCPLLGEGKTQTDQALLAAGPAVGSLNHQQSRCQHRTAPEAGIIHQHFPKRRKPLHGKAGLPGLKEDRVCEIVGAGRVCAKQGENAPEMRFGDRRGGCCDL